MYMDWKDWATKLLDVLKRKQALTVPSYNKADVPTPTSDDLLIIVKNETGGRTLATSFNGKFYRVKDGAEIA